MKTLYLLGAGASANAIPTVAKMEQSIRSWTKSFGYGLAAEFVKELYFSPKPELINKFEWLANGVREFGTPDIFAKSLLLSKKMEDYRIAKATLAAYLLLEQCKNKVDKRYFGFFSALTDINEHSSKIMFHNSIKIATWNYDLQITEALMSLTSFTEREANLHLLKTSDLLPIPETKNKLFRLNGYAGCEIYATDITSNNLSKAYFDVPIESRHPEHIQDMYLNWLGNNTDINFHFAWDNSVPAKQEREALFSNIGDSEVLVIIGYSFPTFNRFIDGRIFHSLRKLKKVYVQDINKGSIDRVNQLIKQSHYVGKESIQTKHISNIDQFYIPNEIDQKG
ncbi:hypothetical protein [Leptospira jelokensis]|uniref:hypothetical protein n=1 Tax=Leptospira jelokensis TaxID=2484931 RepID=UPI0010913329|nr:hypothetical protein [Leptospira jelokensis]TGL97952.1 hypothetical protein EHQ79_19080 [Leptospira jelokensis]